MAQEPALNLQDWQPDSTMNTAPVQQGAIDIVARPTPIRFERPGMARDPNLESLAQGLKQFDGGVQSFLAQRQDQQDQADAARGEADAYKNGAGYAAGVQNGSIPANASPAYVNAYKNAQGQLAGQDLEDKFQAAYDAWPGKNSTDPTAYQKFVTDFFSRNVSTQDPQVLKGLVPVMHQIAQNGYRQHIEQQHQATVQGLQDTQSALVNNGIAAAVGYAKSSGATIDPAYLANSVIGPAYNNARAVGVPPDQAQKNAIIQITTAALLNKDSIHGDEILKTLDQPLPGTNIILSQTDEGAQAKVRVQDELDTAHRQAILQADEIQKKEDAAALKPIEQNVIESLAKNPAQPIDDNTLRAGEKIDPTFRIKVAEWTKTMTEQGGASNPQDMVNLQRDIMNGGGMDVVTHAMDMGTLRNPGDVQKMMEMVKEQAQAAPMIQDLHNSESYKSTISTIKQMVASKSKLDGQPVGTGMEAPGLGLEYELDRRMQSWAAQNPGATYAQVQEQFAKTSADVLKLITKPGDVFGPAQVQPVPGNPYLQGGPTPSPQPQSSTSSSTPLPGHVPQYGPPHAGGSPTNPIIPPGPTPGPVTGQAAPSSAVAGQPAPAPVTTQEVQQWVDKLSPAQQESLARASLRTGRPATDIAMEQYQTLVNSGKVQRPNVPGAPPAGAGTPSATVTPGQASPTNPQGNAQVPLPNLERPVVPAGTYQKGSWEQFGDAIQKWRQTDPNAEATIHQLTGALAGMHAALPYQGSTTIAAIKNNPQAAHILDFIAGPESTGNYNAYYAHANNSTVDFSKMTINEVLRFQHNLVAVDRLPSSALGRYQFMPPTLQGLMKQMGLSGNERFTPELQDELALQLLKNRGLEQWQQGKISDAQFMNNLAFEWASLPNPHTGMSQYHGDGLNKALVSPQQTAKMLAEAKGMSSSAPSTETATAAPAVNTPATATPTLTPTVDISPSGGPWIKYGNKEYATDKDGNIVANVSRPAEQVAAE